MGIDKVTFAGTMCLIGAGCTLIIYGTTNTENFKAIFGILSNDEGRGLDFSKLKSLPITQNASETSFLSRQIQPSKKKSSKHLPQLIKRYEKFQKQKKCSYFFSFDGKTMQDLNDKNWTDNNKTIAFQIFVNQVNNGKGKCIINKNIFFKRIQNSKVWEVSYKDK